MELLYKISYLTVIVGGLSVVLFIIKRRARSKFNIFYSLLNLSMVVWATGRYALLVADDYDTALFWVRILYIGSIMVHVLFLHTILIFLGKEGKRKIILGLVYLNAIFILSLNFIDLITGTNFFIKDLSAKLNFNFFENPNHFYSLHLIVNYLFVTAYTFTEMVFSYKYFQGLAKGQLKYLLLSSLLGFIGGNSVVPLIYNVQIPPFLIFFVPLHLFTMAYAVLRYRLMGIVVLMSKIYILLILSIYLFIALRGLVFANDFFLAFNFSGAMGIVLEFILIMLLALTVLPFINYIQKSSDYLFFKGNNPSNIIKKLSLKLNGVIDIEKLLEILNSEFKKFIGAETLSIIYVTNKEGAKARIEISKKGGIERASIGKDSAICKVIARKNGIIIQDEIEEGDQNEQLFKEMKKYGAYVVSPLESRGKIVGAILLGQKMTQDAYTEEDLEFIEIISSQVAIAIDNARLYREIKEFNERLKGEVKEATDELQGANKDLKTANEKLVVAYEKLHKLDRAKSEFLSIVSHQLRTPLTSIKGFTSLLLEGTYGKISKEVRKILEKVFLSNERLIRLVEDLLNISRIESGRFVFDVKKNNIKSLAKEVVDSFVVPVKAKNMKIKLKMPRKKIPNFHFDRNKIREVISNFIDNSIKYSKKGTIAIEIVDEKRIVRVAVSDNGLGVKKGELDYIFEKFQRGENIATVHTDGIGLGLFVCRKIINAHKGKIWVESKGLGKGSTFIFELKKNFKPKDVEK